MDIRSQLLSEINSHQAKHGLSDKRFGEEAMRDPTFVYRLRKGAGVTVRTIDRVRSYMMQRPAEPVAQQAGGIFE